MYCKEASNFLERRMLKILQSLYGRNGMSLKHMFIMLFSRFKEMKMNAIIKEVALYVFFVACLCIVSYSHRDPTSFAFRETMYNSFVAGVHGGKKNFLSVRSAGALSSGTVT